MTCGLEFLGVDMLGTDWSPAPALAAARAGLAAIKRGHKGDAVVYVQQRVGLDKEADGMFGPGTETALKKFQARNEIPETGVVDKLTMEALDAVNIVQEKAPPGPVAAPAAAAKDGELGARHALAAVLAALGLFALASIGARGKNG